MKHKLDVFSRIIAAVFGGYFLSILFSFACTELLSALQIYEKNEAIMVAAMLSYIVYFGVIITSFCRKSAWLLWRDILVSSVLCFVLYWYL